jgi:hypothetical protein
MLTIDSLSMPIFFSGSSLSVQVHILQAAHKMKMKRGNFFMVFARVKASDALFPATKLRIFVVQLGPMPTVLTYGSVYANTKRVPRGPWKRIKAGKQIPTFIYSVAKQGSTDYECSGWGH